MALVGHEPSMGKLLSALLASRGLAFSKGAVARLELATVARATGVRDRSRRHPAPVPSLDGL